MKSQINKFLFLLMLIELCLGGGGRFITIGPISLRMILYSFAMILSILLIIEKNSLPIEIWKLIIAYALVISLGIAVGLINKNPMNLIFEDVKPLCYFFVLPFFYLNIDQIIITKTITVIKVTSICIAAIFIVLLGLIHLGIIPFLEFYSATLKSQELFYRGEISFFYKGFLFLGIGAIFNYFTDHSKWKEYVNIILITAIVLSVTRGLLFSLILTFSSYFIVTKSYFKSAVGFVCAIAIAVWGSNFILSASRLFDAKRNNISYQMADPTLLGDRKYSDNGRVVQAREVWHEASFSSSLIGHGFGAGTSSRPIHMEISYLEIFHKQGLVGLIFWASLGGMIVVQYRRAPDTPAANAFFYSSLFVFIESFSNQYINNPIGMSVLLLSLGCLYKLKTKE